MSTERRRYWLPQEDAELFKFVDQFGDNPPWEEISRLIGGRRSGNSCRLRYTDHLDPRVAKGSLTHEEMCQIIKLHHRYGNKWAKIAKYMPAREDGLRRTDNRIKNFWNGPITKEANKLGLNVNGDEFLNIILSTTHNPNFHLGTMDLDHPTYYFGDTFNPYHNLYFPPYSPFIPDHTFSFTTPTAPDDQQLDHTIGTDQWNSASYP